jgi:hypothetical protein
MGIAVNTASPTTAAVPLHGVPTGAPPTSLDVDLSTYPTHELQALLNTITRKNELLAVENDMFDAFYSRFHGIPVASLSRGRAGADAVGGEEDLALSPVFGGMSGAAGSEEASSPVNAMRKEEKRLGKKKVGDKGRGGAVGPGGAEEQLLQLTLDQKFEIALKETDQVSDEVERAKAQWIHAIDSIKAEIEESEMRLMDLRKEEADFKCDIVQGAVHPRTGKIMAEKLVRYLEDGIRFKDGLVGKIKLKNATLKSAKKKIQMSLKQKEEMGEVLHAIDFDQLQIENKQYIQKIEERNQELLKLKMTATNTVQTLNSHKVKLGSLAQEAKQLRAEIGSKREFLGRLQQERVKVEEEGVRAEAMHNKLTKAMQEYRVPSILDYVKLKAQEEALGKKVRSWDRKVEIAVMQAHRYVVYCCF